MLAALVQPTKTASCATLPCKRVQVDEIWSFVHSKRDTVKDL
jgi:hypothetical protein